MRILIVAAVIFLASCASEAPAPAQDNASAAASDELAQSGRDIAEAQCAACHAVGVYGASPNPNAPVFRTLLQRYRADVLEEELIEGVRVSHPMPEFQFNPQGTDALIAYLRSIQETPPAQ